MATTKYPASYRLSPEALKLVEQLKEHLGISRTSVIEQAIRHLARREAINQAKAVKS